MRPRCRQVFLLVPTQPVLVDPPEELEVLVREFLGLVDVGFNSLAHRSGVMVELQAAVEDALDSLMVQLRYHVRVEMRQAEKGGHGVDDLNTAAPELLEHRHMVTQARFEDHVLVSVGHRDGEHLARSLHTMEKVHSCVDHHLHQAGLEHVVHQPNTVSKHPLVMQCKLMSSSIITGLLLFLHHRLHPWPQGSMLVMRILRLRGLAHGIHQLVQNRHCGIVPRLQLLGSTTHGVGANRSLFFGEVGKEVDVGANTHYFHRLYLMHQGVDPHQRLDEHRLC
mmetsp:Transcript_1400/g.2520  ORF Transcript_1400/g.2520 Transcript_1400/m.2520 type:complete len:280 (-) Transcript_1400:40-879(-)